LLDIEPLELLVENLGPLAAKSTIFERWTDRIG
jgi:hypothetical protein